MGEFWDVPSTLLGESMCLLLPLHTVLFHLHKFVFHVLESPLPLGAPPTDCNDFFEQMVPVGVVSIDHADTLTHYKIIGHIMFCFNYMVVLCIVYTVCCFYLDLTLEYMARRLWRDDNISNVNYNLEMGFGSISQTLKNAKEQDPSDPSTVWMWIIVCEKRPTKQIRRYRGSNSYTNDKREAKTICCDRAIILSSFIIYIYI